MRYLLFILLLATSCKKATKGKFCYHCTFGLSAGGVTRPPLDTCCDDNPRGDFQFQDGRGNDLTSYCERR